MKARLFFIVAAVAVASVASATDLVNRQFAVVERGNGIFKVIYEGKQLADVQMTIINRYGEVVLTKVFRKTNGFILPVNFNGMKEGDYTIKLESASGKYSKTIQYKVNRARSNEAPVVHVTRLGTANRYLLSIQGNSPEKLDIRVLDKAMNTLYHDSRVIGYAGIVFNLKDLIGSPIFKITTASGEQVLVKK
ncbi:MAG: hypothetical protein HRU69_14980 [Flammeovirgaceae bacterium]|nr:MAG: hypothetical protein HRU69_14980 [Flammeovirgaceae bacterium]